jgi:hypothetical protein
LEPSGWLDLGIRVAHPCYLSIYELVWVNSYVLHFLVLLWLLLALGSSWFALPDSLDLIHNMLLATSLDLKLSYEFWFAMDIGMMPSHIDYPSTGGYNPNLTVLIKLLNFNP